MKEKHKKSLIALKKANTLLQKVLKMTEEDIYCIDIIQQNLAVIGLLKSVNLSLLEGHLNCCVKDAIYEKDTKRTDEMMKELMKVMKTAQKK